MCSSDLNFTTSAKGPIIVEPTPAIEGPILKAKSGNFTTDSRDYKIARNRERNAERQQRIANNRGSNEAKMIDNKVMNMDSRQPLMLESKEAKVEKAFNMLNDGQEEVAEKILDSFSVGGTEPYRKKSEQEIRRKKEAHNNAMHNQVGSIPNEKPVTNRILQPGVASQAGGNESAKNLADKVKGNNFVYNMASLGVGGGLVLNMANNKGQQSNAQLYGQY